MTRVSIAVAALLIATSALAGSGTANAQEQQPSPQLSDERAELRRLLGEADTHLDAGRHALAFQGYMALHARMEELRMPRAVVALWNAGRALAQVPGREREAREVLQRFLDGTTTLAGEADVAEFRSAALARIAELEARLGTAESSSTEESEPAPVELSTVQGGGLSPIGPIVLGVGGAAMIASAIVGGIGLAQDGSLAAMCMGGNCPESARPLASEVKNLILAADVLFLGGLAVAATGVVLTLVLRGGPPPVTAGCGPEGCGLQVQGSF